MRNPVYVLLALVLLASCSNGGGYINYDRWKVSDRNGISYLRAKPAEVATVQYILLEDTSLASAGQLLDSILLRFDTLGNLVYQRTVQGAGFQEDRYFYGDEGPAFRSVMHYNAGRQSVADSTHGIRKRLDGQSFAITYYHGSSRYQEDTMSFGVDSDVRVISRPADHPGYTLTTWYRNYRPAKDEGMDSYGRTGHLYHRDARGNLDSVTFSNPMEKEVFFNNAQGDPVLHYHTLGSDTMQLERISYTYDARGNWTRRLTWQKALQPPVALMKNPRNGHYTLAVRTIKY